MMEWNDPSVKSPIEGELVEIKIPGGRYVKPVKFAEGRFWKKRGKIGGQAYTVESWRSITKRPETVRKDLVDGTD